MAFFVPDQVAPHDPAGWGRWLTGHFLEHQQFVTLAAGLTPPATIPGYDIFAWSDDPIRAAFWRNSHQVIHVSLRQLTGVTGIDLSLVDFTNDSDFLVWLEDHANEHAELRSFFGVT